LYFFARIKMKGPSQVPSQELRRDVIMVVGLHLGSQALFEEENNFFCRATEEKPWQVTYSVTPGSYRGDCSKWKVLTGTFGSCPVAESCCPHAVEVR
jgi:hypothetical protein